MTSYYFVTTAGGERSVFVEPVLIEKRGHLGLFGSDRERVTRCECGCGYTTNGVDAIEVLNDWRAHIRAEAGA